MRPGSQPDGAEQEVLARMPGAQRRAETDWDLSGSDGKVQWKQRLLMLTSWLLIVAAMPDGGDDDDEMKDDDDKFRGLW